MSTWNWLDWTLAAVAVISVLAAFQKGLVRELISLAAVVAGLVVATLGYSRAAVWFDDLTKSHQTAQGLAFATLFLVTLLVGALLSRLAGKLIKKAGLQFFDRFLGAIFGVVRGVALDCILLWVLMTFAIKAEAVRRSTLVPYVLTGAGVVARAMPGDLRDPFRQGLEKFKVSLSHAEHADDAKPKK